MRTVSLLKKCYVFRAMQEQHKLTEYLKGKETNCQAGIGWYGYFSFLQLLHKSGTVSYRPLAVEL